MATVRTTRAAADAPAFKPTGGGYRAVAVGSIVLGADLGTAPVPPDRSTTTSTSCASCPRVPSSSVDASDPRDWPPAHPQVQPRWL